MLHRTLCVLVAVAVAGLTGCVERRFRVETNPPGAFITVNNKPVGPSPVDVEFLYYGHYDILIQKEGFQTERVRQHIKAPWYAYPPIDLVAENFVPVEIQDYRTFVYELKPAIQPNLDLLKAEGEQYRQRAAALPPPRYPDIDKEPRGPRTPPPPPETAPPLVPSPVLPPPSTFPTQPPD